MTMEEYIQCVLYVMQNFEPYEILNNHGIRLAVYKHPVFAELLGTPQNVPNPYLVYLQNQDRSKDLYYILINDAFTELPRRWQLALYEHEYGHYLFGHMPKAVEMRVSRYLPHEYEADTNVTDKEALEEYLLTCIRAIEEDNFPGDIEEFYGRIKALYGEI